MKKHTQSPYESSKVSYKPSGIEWLGEIPQSWEIVKIKQVSKVVTGKTPCLENEWGNEMPFITPTDCFLDTKYTSLSQRKLSKIGIKNYNSIIIPQDSILVTCIASIGKVVMSNKEVITNQQINSVIPNTDLISPDFAFYVLLVTMPFAENYFCGYSILPILNKSEFSNIKIPLPPLQEQKEIAEFLDSKCEKIQNYIDKKQKLITLLQEKKQALINEAVCGRVACHTADSHCHTERSEVSTTAYKDRGIEYLGLIPHHWEVTNLKNIVSIKSGGTPSRDNKDYWNGDIPWIRSEFCHNQHIFQCDVKEKITTLGLQKSSAKMCEKNTILIALVGATIGQVAFLNFKSAINQNIAAIYPNNAAILDNVFLFFVALTFKQRFEILGKYAIANLAFIGNLKIPLPPLQEQKEIAAFLDSKVAQIDSVIEKTKKQIELIKEYKNTLINEAVCGRIRVN